MLEVQHPPASLDHPLVIPDVKIIEPTPIKPPPSKPFPSDPSHVSTPLPTSLTSAAPSHRVLYRGSLSFASSEVDVPLEGICFVAHFDSASPSRSALLSSPLPLALESQRGRQALSIIRELPIDTFNERIDDSLDLRMYIHDQALITHVYFERLLCMEDITRDDGRTSTCLRVRLGDDQDEEDDIAVYGQLLPNATGTSLDVNGLPRICIRAARILPPPPKVRVARPDDPLPRAARFPADPFPVHRNSKLKRPHQLSSSSLPIIPEPPKKQARLDKPTHNATFRVPISKSSSSSASAATASSSSSRHEKAIPMMGKAKGHIHRSSSPSATSLVDDGDDYDDDDEPTGHAGTSARSVRRREGGDDDVFGSSDYDLERGKAKPGAKRKSSGLFDIPELMDPIIHPPRVKASGAKANANGSPAITSHRNTLSGGDATVNMTVTTEEDSLHRSNKDLIKRQTLTLLGQRGVLKDHEDFKELYQMIIRGVAFVLRPFMSARRIEREEARSIVVAHLDLYLPLLTPIDDTDVWSSPTVKSDGSIDIDIT